MRSLSAIFLLLTTSPLFAQQPLHQTLVSIATDAHGQVAVACSLPGTPLACDLDADSPRPLLSVFKLPIDMAVLHQVELGKFSLNQPIRFLPSDRILGTHYSPLQNAYPNANVDIPLRKLLQLTVGMSDGVAADVLLRTIGGPSALQSYLDSISLPQIHIRSGEEKFNDPNPAVAAAAMRLNIAPAAALVQLLRDLADHSPLTPAHTALLLHWMYTTPVTPNRIKGLLPPGTLVAHKSGTSGELEGLALATNDTALITLPDGRRLALAIFVTNSHANEDIRDLVIARIAQAIYKQAISTQRGDNKPQLLP